MSGAPANPIRRRVVAALAAAPLGLTARGARAAVMPEIFPAPIRAAYGETPLPLGEELALGRELPSALRAALEEVAGEWRIALSSQPARPGHSRIEIAVRDRPGEDRSETGRQGYRLEVNAASEGAAIRIVAGDAAGAFYGLQSLRQLAVRGEAGLAIRPAEVSDWPRIARRGLIWFGGPSRRGESIAALLRLASRYKMNFFMGPEVRVELEAAAAILPRLRELAAALHIELAALLGGGEALLRIPEGEIVAYYEARAALGFDTLTVNFDDLGLETPQEARAAARVQLAIANRVHGELRARWPGLRFIFCPVTYGGLPGRFAFVKPGADGAYLDAIARGLPADVPAFWTGDGGVFSPTVTAEGAAQFARAAGRKPFFWDNDAIRFANRFAPLAGRDPKLHEQIDGYVANLNEFETEWRAERNAEFTLLTAACYAWNPEAYAPEAAAAAARAALGIPG